MFATCLSCTIVSKIRLFLMSQILTFRLVSQIIISLSNAIGISTDVTGVIGGDITAFKVFIPIIMIGCIIFPLSLMRNLSAVRYLSLASLISLSLTLAVVVIEMPFYVKRYHPTLTEDESRIRTVCPSFSFFGSAGIVFFAFTNQAQLLPIYNNLDNPIKRRIIKVIARSTSIVTTFYLLMGLFGYLATANMTSEIVLFREPLPG